MFASLAHFAAPTGLGIKRSNTTQPVLEKQCRDPNRFLGKINQQKRLQLDSHLQDERCERSYNQHKSGSNAFFVHGLVAVVTGRCVANFVGILATGKGASPWHGMRLRRLGHSTRSGYGSIPIHTIFSGMNIHLPAILMFTRGTRF